MLALSCSSTLDLRGRALLSSHLQFPKNSEIRDFVELLSGLRFELIGKCEPSSAAVRFEPI